MLSDVLVVLVCCIDQYYLLSAYSILGGADWFVLAIRLRILTSNHLSIARSLAYTAVLTPLMSKKCL